MAGVQRVLGYADPVVGDAQGFGCAGEKAGQPTMIVWLRLIVVGHSPGVGQERRAVDRPDAPGLPLDPYPAAHLVLVGDDDNMIGDRWQTSQRLPYPDEVLNYAVASPHGQNVARGGRANSPLGAPLSICGTARQDVPGQGSARYSPALVRAMPYGIRR